MNVCIPGDVLRLVGIVKAMQNDAPRGGGRAGGGGRGGGGVSAESGLHQLYVVANSLQCVKASGDRGSTVIAPVTSTSATSASTAVHVNAASSSSSAQPPVPSSSAALGLGLGRPSLVSFTPTELATIRVIAMMADNAAIAAAENGGGDGNNSMGCVGLLTASLCPTIFGHDLVKVHRHIIFINTASYVTTLTPHKPSIYLLIRL